MQADEDTQWREKIMKANQPALQDEHAAIDKPDAQIEQREQSHERSNEHLAVLAVQIAPQLKKDVLKLADESGLTVDEAVNGVLHRAVLVAQREEERVKVCRAALEGLGEELRTAKIAQERELLKDSPEPALSR